MFNSKNVITFVECIPKKCRLFRKSAYKSRIYGYPDFHAVSILSIRVIRVRDKRNTPPDKILLRSFRESNPLNPLNPCNPRSI